MQGEALAVAPSPSSRCLWWLLFAVAKGGDIGTGGVYIKGARDVEPQARQGGQGGGWRRPGSAVW